MASPATRPTTGLSPDWRFLATLASITLIGPLAIHAFLPAMPAIKTVFSLSETYAGMAFTVTLLVVAFATLAYGSLSDRHGRRPVLLAGIAVFIAGSVLCALAGSFTVLLAGRVLQALGVGCSVTLSRAIARDAYGTEGLVKVIAYLTMAYTLGPMVSPFIGGLLVDHIGWQGVFWIAAGAGVMIGWASFSILPETHPPSARQGAHTQSYFRDYVQLFSHLRFAGFVFQSGFSSGCFYTMAAASAFLMKDYLGRSASEFGAYFFLFPIGFFSGNFLSSRLSHRFGIEKMVLAGALVNFSAITLQSAAILADFVTPLVLFIPGFLTTFGQGLALPNSTTGAMRVVPKLGGTAAGIGVFCQTFVGALFAQLYSIVSDGTPLRLAQVNWPCSLLCLTMGMIPFALRDRTKTAVPKSGA